MKEKERVPEREQAAGSIPEVASQGRTQGNDDRESGDKNQRGREAVLEERTPQLG